MSKLQELIIRANWRPPWWAVVLLALSALVILVEFWWNRIGFGEPTDPVGRRLFLSLSFVLHLYALVGISGGLAVIFWSAKQLREMKQRRLQELTPEQTQYTSAEELEVTHDPRWEQIREHINSGHPNDWKMAVIEADMILDQILNRQGYFGDSVGEKLKQVDPSDLLTLERAWSAHKVRNRIAHESQLTLGHREAQRAIENYRAVFEEFHFL